MWGKHPPYPRRGARVIKCTPLLVATAALVLSACGSAADPARTTVAAAQKTAALSWVRYQIRFTGSHLFPPALGITGARGAYDFRTTNDYAFINLRTRGGGSENVFVDSSPTGLAVAPSPAPAGLLPAGKAWIFAPVKGRRVGDPLVAQVEGLAPLLAVDEIKWGTRSASSLGTRPVGHVPMGEYRVTVDLAKAYSAARKHGDAAVAAAIKHELHASPSGRLNIDVWVDGPGYIAQIFKQAPNSGLGATTLSFLSYSQRYDGVFPAASQTAPLASLRPGRRSVWAIATGS
jgi:hypothetical protein